MSKVERIYIGKGEPSILIRNNTSFPVKASAKLLELYKSYLQAQADTSHNDHKWAMLLKYYQYLARAVMSDPEYGIGSNGNARGLLIYHTMGMGKTRLAVGIAMSLWDVRPVVVMLSRSLQANFKKTVHDVLDLLNESSKKIEADKKFTFVSMDAYNSADQMARAGAKLKNKDITNIAGGLDGKLLIVDEAHNFFRAIINSSAEVANARRIYDMIMSARNLRIIFLTGTPASKDPFELVPCFNMLTGTDILPTQYDIFYKLYVDREAHKVRNFDRLANRLIGLVSHVTPELPSEPHRSNNFKDRDDGWFPEEFPTIVERVEMSEYQYRQYLLIRTKEDAESKAGEGFGKNNNMSSPALALPGSERKAMRSYFVKSRTISIFCPAKNNDFTKLSAPKLALIAERADKAFGPVLVYSQFVDSGLRPLGEFLQLLGYEPYILKYGSGDIPKAIFTSHLVEWEWAALELTDKLLNDLVKNLSHPKKIRECRNAFERWLQTAVNNYLSNTDKPWTLHRALLNADKATTDKFLTELATAGHSSPRSAVKRIIASIETAVSIDVFEVVPISVWFSPGNIHIKRLEITKEFKLHTDQAKALLARAKTADPVATLVRALLRYEAALSGSQQLGLPRKLYEKLYDLGIRNEGFASPFNSRMVALNKPDTMFCSLFLDTDAPFGSLGPFQLIDMESHPGGWTINPPFIETIIDITVDKIIDTLDNSKIDILLLLPSWDNSEIINIAINNSYVVANKRLHNYTLEEPGGRQFKAPFDLYHIALSSITNTKIAEIMNYEGGSGVKGHYAIISGDVSNENRIAITEAFNSDANAHGDIIKAILVSKTGAEGLDLKWIRETHQIEPYWDKARDHQVIARARRIGSHDGLPSNERDVQPYLYIATANQTVYQNMLERDREPKSIDEIFYDKANERFETNSAFRKLLTKVCLECDIFGYGDCRVCIPTNAPLFHDDPALDIRIPDPCEIRYESDVEAIAIGNYYYKVDKSNPVGYVFYKFSEEFNGFTAVDPSDPIVHDLIKLLNEKDTLV
jgi:hypothetical protein